MMDGVFKRLHDALGARGGEKALTIPAKPEEFSLFMKLLTFTYDRCHCQPLSAPRFTHMQDNMDSLQYMVKINEHRSLNFTLIKKENSLTISSIEPYDKPNMIEALKDVYRVCFAKSFPKKDGYLIPCSSTEEANALGQFFESLAQIHQEPEAPDYDLSFSEKPTGIVVGKEIYEYLRESEQIPGVSFGAALN